jgi:hypothetical protein
VVGTRDEVHDVDGVLRVEDLMVEVIGNAPVDKEEPPSGLESMSDLT